MNTRTSVALWISIGLHSERLSVRTPDYPKIVLCLFNIIIGKKNNNFINRTARYIF